ncbi:CLC_0170 family protein [Anaeroselena agilis]|uniref:Uncharacterized protein n=1 Tax=Anaeroselena agilis TaxID=3063788 RepID=A0ABU3NXQ9_9FIRM|nr:hypothetical protein [Selenomonadales bacterium 4137-cl]
MGDQSVFNLLTNPFDSSFAIMVILVGVYSLLINVRQATQQNCLRGAKVARIAGWCYIVAGVGILIMS